MKRNKSHKGIENDLIAALIIIVLYVGFYFLGIGCPIRYVTGISCAGCGMERAWLSLLHGNVFGAFHYHPLFFMPAIWAVILIFRRKIPQKGFFVILWISVGLFLAVYLYRMIFENGDVLQFKPQNGIIYRIIERIIRIIRKAEETNVL